MEHNHLWRYGDIYASLEVGLKFKKSYQNVVARISQDARLNACSPDLFVSKWDCTDRLRPFIDFLPREVSLTQSPLILTDNTINTSAVYSRGGSF
ncbi:hypothetical protein J6590_073823 [Homalodisca vitripennis]|nr:hypothetical protein J6590_073823 [Homalodisca vitripennis]